MPWGAERIVLTRGERLSTILADLMVADPKERPGGKDANALKVALVHDWLTGMRGGEKCLAALCRRFPDAELFTLLRHPGKTAPAIERMRITTSFLQRLPGITRHYRYWLPLMPKAIESLRIPPDVDLVVSFSHAVAKSIQPPPGVPHVCYCFTPMRYAWQLRGDYFGARRRLSPSAPLAKARDVLLDRIRHWDRATCDRVTHYIAISRTISERIAACYDRPSTVIYPPVDTDFYSPAPVPREDFYLCVSALVPYKKTELAVQACRRLGRRLVVIGAGPGAKTIAAGGRPRRGVAGLAVRRGNSRLPASLPGSVISGPGRFRHRAGRGASLRRRWWLSARGRDGNGPARR